MRALLALLVILLVPSVALAGGKGGGKSNRSSGDVSVRGHVRSDGTYVAPHYRTRPDSSFSNNWSTVGNTNPYTGKEGTKTYPSSGYSYRPSQGSPSSYNSRNSRTTTASPPGATSASRPATSYYSEGTATHRPDADAHYSDSLCESVAARVRNYGYSADCSKQSFLTLSDWESRIQQAQKLRALGYEVDWRQHEFLTMSDWESRIQQAQKLRALGYEVDWRQHEFLKMSDWESRIQQAERLHALGYDVDWKKHSWRQLYEMEQTGRRESY